MGAGNDPGNGVNVTPDVKLAMAYPSDVVRYMLNELVLLAREGNTIEFITMKAAKSFLV